MVEQTYRTPTMQILDRRFFPIYSRNCSGEEKKKERKEANNYGTDGPLYTDGELAHPLPVARQTGRCNAPGRLPSENHYGVLFALRQKHSPHADPPPPPPPSRQKHSLQKPPRQDDCSEKTTPGWFSHYAKNTPECFGQQ